MTKLSAAGLAARPQAAGWRRGAATGSATGPLNSHMAPHRCPPHPRRKGVRGGSASARLESPCRPCLQRTSWPSRPPSSLEQTRYRQEGVRALGCTKREGRYSLLRKCLLTLLVPPFLKPTNYFRNNKPMNYGHSIPRWPRTDALPISAEGDAVTVRTPWTCSSDVCYLCRVIACATSAS